VGATGSWQLRDGVRLPPSGAARVVKDWDQIRAGGPGARSRRIQGPVQEDPDGDEGLRKTSRRSFIVFDEDRK